MADTRHFPLMTTSCCAKLLLKTFLTIFIFVQLQANVSGVIYESVQWISKNPRFMVGTENQNCKADEVLEIRVTVGSKLTFICPTPVMVLNTIKHDIPKESLYENLWIVPDERSFNTCTVPNPRSASKYLLSCDDPLSLVYRTVIFNIYSATDHLAFPDEKYYYFFSTSDGTVGTLNNTAHGHCNDTKEKVAMKFRLLLCKEASLNPKCNDTNFPFGKFRCVSGRAGTPVPTPSPSTSPTQTLPGVLSTSYSQLNTAITVTSPVSQVCSATTVTYTTTVQQAATVTINPTQCQCATTSVINSTISFSTKEPSGEGPRLSQRTGSKDMTELDKWQVTAGVFIFLCAVLFVVLIVGHFKYGKNDTCFSDINKVDCLSTSKNDKYKNPDAEKGNVTPNSFKDAEFRKSMYGEEQETDRKGLNREKSVQGHENRAYRESVSGNNMSEIQHQDSTEVRNEGKTGYYGDSNEAFDAPDGSKSKVFPDVNNTRIESSFKGDRSGGYEMLQIDPKDGLKGKNMINSRGIEVKVKADKSPVIENKLPVIENNIPNGTPRSKRVDVRA